MTFIPGGGAIKLSTNIENSSPSTPTPCKGFKFVKGWRVRTREGRLVYKKPPHTHTHSTMPQLVPTPSLHLN